MVSVVDIKALLLFPMEASSVIPKIMFMIGLEQTKHQIKLSHF